MLPSRSKSNATQSPSLRRASLAIACGIRTARLFPHFETVVSFRICIYFEYTSDPPAIQVGDAQLPYLARNARSAEVAANAPKSPVFPLALRSHLRPYSPRRPSSEWPTMHSVLRELNTRALI